MTTLAQASRTLALIALFLVGCADGEGNGPGEPPIAPTAATAQPETEPKVVDALPFLQPSYSYYVTGHRYFDTGDPTPISQLPMPQPKVAEPFVIMGGGPDVDEAYRWMISSAGITRQTGGRFVVIRTSGSDAYNPYLYFSDDRNSTAMSALDGYVGGAYMGLTLAETLIVRTRDAANDPFVNAIVMTANALWIAGGDQTTYIDAWKGTALARSLQTLMERNVPVGGTSAGAAVLGQFVFYAKNGTVTSDQALKDPFNHLMSFDPFPFSEPSLLNVPPLIDTFVDTHFDERDRMGRLLTFMARTVKVGGQSGCPGGTLTAPWQVHGIGLGVETALQLQRRGDRYYVRRLTNPTTTTASAVHFVRLTIPPTVCAERTPLTAYTVQSERLVDSAHELDLTNWRDSGSPSSHVSKFFIDVNAGEQSPISIAY